MRTQEVILLMDEFRRGELSMNLNGIIEEISKCQTKVDARKIRNHINVDDSPELLIEAMKQGKSGELILAMAPNPSNRASVFYRENILNRDSEIEEAKNKGAHVFYEERNGNKCCIAAYDTLFFAVNNANNKKELSTFIEVVADDYVLDMTGVTDSERREIFQIGQNRNAHYYAGIHCSKSLLEDLADNPPMENIDLIKGIAINKYMTSNLLKRYVEYMPTNMKAQVFLEIANDLERSNVKRGDLVNIMLESIPEAKDILRESDIEKNIYSRENIGLTFWHIAGIKEGKDVLKNARQKLVDEFKAISAEQKSLNNDVNINTELKKAREKVRKRNISGTVVADKIAEEMISGKEKRTITREVGKELADKYKREYALSKKQKE